MYSKVLCNFDGSESYNTFETPKEGLHTAELQTIVYPKERGKQHKFRLSLTPAR